MTALTAGPKSGQTMKVTITFYDGQGGILGTEHFIDGVDGWSFDNSITSKEVTTAKTTNDTLWRQYMSTLRDAKGTITFKYLNLSDVGQAALWTLFNSSSLIAEMRFYQDATHYLYADCICTKFPIAVKLDGVQGEGMSVDVQLQDLNGLQLGGYA
jgi:hypothetical protein